MYLNSCLNSWYPLGYFRRAFFVCKLWPVLIWISNSRWILALTSRAIRIGSPWPPPSCVGSSPPSWGVWPPRFVCCWICSAKTNLSDLDLQKLVISWWFHHQVFGHFFPKTVGRLVDVSNFPLLILLEAWQGPDLVLCLPQQRLCHARSQRHLVNTKLAGGLKNSSYFHP